MNHSINGRIKDVISRRSRVSSENLDDELPLEKTEIDSLGIMEATFDLEDAFGIEIPITSKYEMHFRTVGDVVEYIESIILENQKES